MGEVIDIEAARRARRERLARSGDPFGALEAAVARVEHLLGPRTQPPASGIERELAAITRAVGEHQMDVAIERAERLADRLEHPAAGVGQ